MPAFRRIAASSSAVCLPWPVVYVRMDVESRPVPSSVTWDALRQLAGFRAEKGCAISLFVDLDPSLSPTPGDARTRIHSLLDEGEKHSGGAAATHEQRLGLKADFERLRQFFSEEFQRDGTRGYAVFCAGLDNLWRTVPLTERVPDEIKVSRDLYLAPLVPLLGRGEGAVVAVVSREQGRLYRLRAGRLDEVADLYEEQPRRHDQGGWSQARMQRHVDELAKDHLKTVADELMTQLRRLHFPRVVVVCPEELKSEFADALAGDARAAVIGWTTAKAHASPVELLDAALPVLEDWRERQEADTVERWKEEAGRHGRATSGWEATLEAASDARVECLLVQEGVEHPAWVCPACGRVSVSGGRCPLDGTEMERRDEGLDLAVHQVLAHGGQILAVRSRRDLEPVGGLGALLRF
jgi:peptide chain release factor subunit 1